LTQKQQRQRYLERLTARLATRRAYLEVIGNRYTWARLGIFLIGGAVVAAITFSGFGGVPLSLASFVIWLVVFAAAVRYHRRVSRSIDAHKMWATIKETHVARMALDWERVPPAWRSEARPDHPFETDLNLAGRFSLHRLVDTSVSREGARRLLDWLSAETPDLDAVRERQALVKELVPLARFRDRLSLYAAMASKGAGRRWDGARVLAWLDDSIPPVSPAVLYGLAGFAVVNLLLLVVCGLASLPPVWMATYAVYFGVYLWFVQGAGDLFKRALALADPVNDLKAVFAFLETYRYGENARLRALCAPYLDPVQRPSSRLRTVSRVIAAASVRANPVFWFFISAVTPWDLFVARWLERSRDALRADLPRWLDTWFELEALNSLATFAYLNPGYTFPELLDEAEPVFEAEALGHPLIPDDVRICNDFALSWSGEVALVTGSNMSGKSTFLRTLGLNLCLAYAGGPVNARVFRAVPFRLFTAIQVTDSVVDGISYFYAEVKRLKALLDALSLDHPYPLFFLIDEIFRGTNNRERLVGSRSYIRALVGKRGVGMISTHDLELVRLADEMAQLSNYHFQETVADGRMQFDYKLRPGPCPTTNALRIMQMEGLPVDAV
jgi:hypothetical protein